MLNAVLASSPMNNQEIGPLTLEGKFVKLEPLCKNHADGLAEAAAKLDCLDARPASLKTRCG